MLPERDRTALEDMLVYAREAAQAARGRCRGDLETDRFFCLGLQRLVEIIGEAARRVSHETQLQYPQVPWKQVVGMRNRLIHGYDVVDADVLWDTVLVDLPPLVDSLEMILAQHDAGAADRTPDD